ncbi:MAG: ABC transporter ATP-binding protein [Thermoanaerobacteraceae bacterium]|nr:ABC transporter ATP-binding protein [Thermoanaerobacteraceae bacterium]
MKPAIILRDLWWRYPAFTGKLNPWALQGVDLEIEAGEFVALTGPSGAGKTTLCSIIAGIIPHAIKVPYGQVNNYWRGSVEVLGEPVTYLEGEGSQAAIRGRGVLSPRVGLVMQDPENQFLRMSVLHEVALGMQILQLPASEIEARAREALKMVNLEHLWPRASLTHPADLSGGQKQRVALASFLAMRPEILVLDEPTSDLDPVGKREVMAAVKSLKEQYGLTVILVEHNPEVIMEFADRVILLDEGRIHYTAPPAVFYNRVDELERHGVMVPEAIRVLHAAGCPLEDHAPVTVQGAAARLAPRLQSMPVPRPDPPPPRGEAVIRVEEVEQSYPDGTVALKGVTLQIYRGEFLALLGANGSGKTTLSKVLCGIYPLSKGKAEVLGLDIRSKKVRSQLPRYVGYVFQNPEHQIFTRSVFDDVAYGLRHMGLPEEEIKRRVARALEIVGLSELAEEDPLFLGKGQKQRLAVASIVAMEPEILIVDEPTTGQDYRMSANIMTLLQELNLQGTTLIVITHDMSLVTTYCPRSVVLREGRVVFDGDTRDLFSSPDLVEEALLYPPQAVQLTWEIQKLKPEWPSLISVKEWEQVLSSGEAKLNENWS